MDTFALTLHHDRMRQLQADADRVRHARNARPRRRPWLSSVPATTRPTAPARRHDVAAS